MFQDITVLCSIDYGVGTGGTRNVWGNSVLHEVLENEIVSLNKKEATLIFTSCYVTNDTTLFTLATKSDTFLNL